MSEFHKGKQLQEEGTLEEAIAAYNRKLELNSNDSWAYHHIGEALAKLGRFDEAVTAFRHAIEIKPDFSWSYHHLGDALAQQQHWEESATAFRKAIELNPEHFGTYVGLGNSLAKLGQLDEAISAYRRASELNPDADWIHSALANSLQQRNQSALAEASASYRQMIELNPDNVEAYQNLLQLQPDNWELWLQLGNTLVQQGKLEEAIAAYRRAIEHNPQNQTAYYGLGESLANLGQLEEAIAAYRQAIQLSEQEKQKASTLEPTEDREEAIKRYRHAIEDNPDNISEYYKRLELEPDNQEVLLQLAQALVRQEQIEDAIAAYRRLVELSPCEEYYQELGELLVKQEKWDDAIATYRSALELNPEAYECHHQLGEAIYHRVMENPEAFFSEYKLAEVTHKDYQVFDPELPFVCFLNDQTFLQATSHLDDATYTVEWYRVYLRRSLSEAEKQGCINWLQTPGHSRELGLKVWRETLAEFQTLLRRSFTIVGLEEAVKCYRRALTINPTHCPSYYGLGDALNQQGQTNEAIIIYHKLSMFLAEEGKLHEAVSCFRKTPQRQPIDGEIYEQIWMGLNGLGILNENNPYYPTDISSQPVHHYFSNKNQYQIINLTALTNTDQSFLENSGLSVAILELIRLDQITLEEIYINSFRADSLQRLSTSPNRIHNGYPPESWGKSIYLQQSIVETGYVYCPCPFTGKILKSSDSFYVFPGIFYRFVSRDVFYLLVGEWYGSKLCFYYPRLDIIIVLQPQQEHLNFSSIINVFKAYMVSRWKKVKSYLSQDKKEVAAIGGRIPNPGHYIWNELTALEYLSKNRTLDKIDKFLVGLYEYFYIDDIFPEISSENIIRVPDIHESIYDSILDHNCLAVMPTEYFISQSLANRIYQSSVHKCSADFLQKIEAAKTHFPLLWITLRNYKRKWLSQVEGTINIIKSLYQEFPNLSIVFDAWSVTEREPGHYDSIIATEQECLKQILAQLPPTINIYSTIGCPIYETVVWANAIDLYIAPFGTGMTFVTWLATKPGVAHGNKAYYNAVENSFSEICREEAIRPSYVSLERIIDDENNPDPFTRNYDCDWQVIYNELMQILQNLPKRI